MRERRRVQAISVGVQGVCRLYMGTERGWEEDGIFERGVEIGGGGDGGGDEGDEGNAGRGMGGGDREGIWLEKGSQRCVSMFLLKEEETAREDRKGDCATRESATSGGRRVKDNSEKGNA